MYVCVCVYCLSCVCLINSLKPFDEFWFYLWTYNKRDQFFFLISCHQYYQQHNHAYFKDGSGTVIACCNVLKSDAAIKLQKACAMCYLEFLYSVEQQNGDHLLVITIKNLLHWLAAFCAEIELKLFFFFRIFQI